MADGKIGREALAEAIRELRAEVAALRAERDAHHCHAHSLCCSHVHCNWGHCHCFAVHSYALYQQQIPQVWCGTVGSSETVGGLSAYGYSVTNSAVASGANGLSVSNLWATRPSTWAIHGP